MKVLLIKDVYKLGRAGDVKRVADGYGRNFLIPQGLAVRATIGALKQADRIRSQADANRALVNQEMGGVAEILSKLTLTFAAKAGETGKLYGSVTPMMIADAIQEEVGVEVNRRQMDFSPIRNLGIHKVDVRLTIDLIPEITVIVYREGESPEMLEAELAELEASTVDEAEEATAEAGPAAQSVEEVEAELEPPSLEEEVETEPVEGTETPE